MQIAVVQFAPGPDPAENLSRIGDLARRGADGGARLLIFPEGSLVEFIQDSSAPGRLAEPVDGRFATGLLEVSQRLGVAIAAGSFTPVENRVQNTLLVADRGALVAAYHKVHLYDAFDFLESDGIAAGTVAPPVLDIGGVAVGFATCYDLRFPELFRVLAAGGAQVLAVAAAWVSGPLKEEHWLTLLRARAIENTSYVVGAGQPGRRTIGRSAAFDPMGLPLLDLGTAGDAVGRVEIDRTRLDEVRTLLPSLRNRRFPIGELPR